MRISADSNDTGYHPNCREYEAYLDGEWVGAVITADTEKGYILKYAQDENGRIISDDENNPITEELYGEVEIKRSS